MHSDSGNDVFYSGKGADVLNGGAGNDKLDARAQADQLSSGIGDDTLDGGKDAETLTGGLGADHLVFDKLKGHDRVPDFTTAEGDRIEFATKIGNRNMSVTDFIAAYAKVEGDQSVFQMPMGDTLQIDQPTDLGALASFVDLL